MESISQAIIRWLPVVLLVGLWFYFMTKIKASRKQELVALFGHMERVEGLLDRIAVTLERGIK